MPTYGSSGTYYRFYANECTIFTQSRHLYSSYKTTEIGAHSGAILISISLVISSIGRRYKKHLILDFLAIAEMMMLLYQVYLFACRCF